MNIPSNYNGWEISWDGFVPVCKKCGSEAVNRVMTKFCPNCGKNMRRIKKKNFWDKFKDFINKM